MFPGSCFSAARRCVMTEFGRLVYIGAALVAIGYAGSVGTSGRIYIGQSTTEFGVHQESAVCRDENGAPGVSTNLTLDVEGEPVSIHRDECGVPHIFAKTNKALFTGYGYAVAEDRLWQLELFRHAAE